MNQAVLHRFQRFSAWVIVGLCLTFGLTSVSGGLNIKPAQAAEYTVKQVPNIHLADGKAYVSNPDGILSAIAVAEINRIAADLDSQYGIELAVVVIESVVESEPRMFATELFSHWGIGKAGKDNGLLVLLLTRQDQRQIIFETGYGLEGILPDAICFRLQQQYMLPDFSEGRYSEGMLKGVRAIAAHLAANETELENMKDEEDGYQPLFIILGMFFLPLGLILLANRGRRRKNCPSCGQRTYVYDGLETITAASFLAPGVGLAMWHCKKCGFSQKVERTLPRLAQNFSGNSGGLGGGYSGGGGFGKGHSGRSGGFGGGRSGGGGASSKF